MFAAVTPSSERPVRHYEGLPGTADRHELPRPTVVLIDETDDGIYLIRLADDGAFCGDTWHLTSEEARGQAEFEFASLSAWRDVPGDVSDPKAYALRSARTG